MQKLGVDQALDRARDCAAKGEVQSAIAIYRRVLEKYPGHRRARRDLTNLAPDALSSAARSARKGMTSRPEARRADPKPAAGTPDLERLLALYNAGRLAAVLEMSDDLSGRYPDAFLLWQLRGAAAARLGRLPVAEDAMRRAIALKPASADAHNNLGNLLRARERPDQAVPSYRRALDLRPGFAAARANLGYARYELGQHDAAADAFRRALRDDPAQASAQNGLGLTLLAADRPAEARAALDAAIALRPDYPEAHLNLALACLELDDEAAAQSALQAAIAQRPEYWEAHFELGRVLQGAGAPDAARTEFLKVCSLKPDCVEAYVKLGGIDRSEGDLVSSEESLRQALRVKPDDPDALHGLANVLALGGSYRDAVDMFAAALAADPDRVESRCNLASVHLRLKDPDAARTEYEHALGLAPDLAEARLGMARAHLASGADDAALDWFRAALELSPEDAELSCEAGRACLAAKRREEAEALFRSVLDRDPEMPAALFGLGDVRAAQHRWDEAIAAYEAYLDKEPDCYMGHRTLGIAALSCNQTRKSVHALRRALELRPGDLFVISQKLHQQQHLCDWSCYDLPGETDAMLDCETGEVQPWILLGFEDDPRRQRQRSELWARGYYGHISPTIAYGPRPAGPRLRIGYVSADFYNHATAHLIAGLLREHDRDAVEVVAYSYGGTKGGDMRTVLEGSVDRFVDMAHWSIDDIVARMRADEIDIAVDLKGYTREARLEMFAERVAPIQISHLGYPGTLGAEFFDYFVADRTVIPEDLRSCYTEKLIFLPGSYQPNNDRRRICPQPTTRAEFGLPENAVVFCSFNANYKITPESFDVWMRLLRDVPHSVLWLLRSNNWAQQNLRREAAARGVDPARLVFAKNLRQAQHLARHRHADIFLDTFRVNAHTTASDALWAGLPVVTLQGRQFAARVASSLLRAVGLPELVTTSVADYEGLARDLALDPERRLEIRARLEANRLESPLFDTTAYARAFEDGLHAAWHRFADGLPPEDIDVTPRP